MTSETPPPTLLVRPDSLAEAVRAVPSERWATWLGVDGGPYSVYGTLAVHEGVVVELRSEQDDSRRACTIAWTDDVNEAIALVPEGRALGNGLASPELRDALFDFALRGETGEGESVLLDADSSGDRSPGAIPMSRVLGRRIVEYDSVATLELAGELHTAEPNAVEVARHLTRRGFKNSPRLLAVLTLRDLETGAERFWGALREQWPKTVPGEVAFRVELESSYLTDRARELGATLWQLHRSLADGHDSLRFAPRPIAGEDIEGWHHALVESATRAMNGLLRVRDRLELESDVAPLKDELPARLNETLSHASMLVSKLGGAAGKRARVHGALDLDALVRRTDGAFLFVEFERGHDRLDSPIRDLATLLHSLSLHLRESSCLREVRAALLNGYFDEEGEQDLVPPTPHRLLSLAQLLELTVAYQDLESRIYGNTDCAPALLAIEALIGVKR